jgi:hypothetical protein
MNKCTFCGRESNCHDTREVGGYTILECCTDCEGEILEQGAIRTRTARNQSLAKK